MRILVLTDRYPPYLIGGYEVACRNVAERLRDRDHDVRVLTSQFGVGAALVEGHVDRVLHRPQDCRSMFQLGWREAQDRRTLRRVIEQWRPDIVYAWCMNQLFTSLHAVLRSANVPVVFNIQDIWLPSHLRHAQEYFDQWRGSGRSAVKRVAIVGMSFVLGIQREPLRWNDIAFEDIVFCSEYRHTEHLKLGLPLGRGTVIYNGVDLPTDDPARFDNRVVRALFAGRLVVEKGAHIAVEAMGALRAQAVSDVSLDIAGVPSFPWEYGDQLREAVAQHRLDQDVHVLGPIAHTEMAATYRDHNVLVFPSTINEGLPVTIIEAMAHGLAIVATNTGGTPEIVQDGVNGLLCPPDDSEAIARALRSLRDEPNLRKQLSVAARATVEQRFGLGLIADQTAAHLQDSIAQFRARRAGVAA